MGDGTPNPHSSFGGLGSSTKPPAAAGTVSAPDALTTGVAGAIRLHRRGCEGTVPSRQLCLGYVAPKNFPRGGFQLCFRGLCSCPQPSRPSLYTAPPASYLCKML